MWQWFVRKINAHELFSVTSVNTLKQNEALYLSQDEYEWVLIFIIPEGVGGRRETHIHRQISQHKYEYPSPPWPVSGQLLPTANCLRMSVTRSGLVGSAHPTGRLGRTRWNVVAVLSVAIMCSSVAVSDVHKYEYFISALWICAWKAFVCACALWIIIYSALFLTWLWLVMGSVMVADVDVGSYNGTQNPSLLCGPLGNITSLPKMWLWIFLLCLANKRERQRGEGGGLHSLNYLLWYW